MQEEEQNGRIEVDGGSKAKDGRGIRRGSDLVDSKFWANGGH